MVSPCRDDFTSARRAAKQLALAGQVAALYCHTCCRCHEIQDAEDPRRCCGPVRPMLAIVRPERRKLILHPAPAPGGEPPVWINAVIEPRSPGQLPVADLADLAALAIRRCYEQLGAGDVAVSLQEAVAATRLFWQMERDSAIAELAKARAELAKARAELAKAEKAFTTALWTARRHLWSVEDQRRWGAFMDDLRAELERVLGPSAACYDASIPRAR